MAAVASLENKNKTKPVSDILGSKDVGYGKPFKSVKQTDRQTDRQTNQSVLDHQ